MREAGAYLLYNELRTGDNEGVVVALLIASCPDLRKLGLRCGLEINDDMADVLARTVWRTQMVGPLQLNQVRGTLNTQASLLANTSFAMPLDVSVAGAGPILTNIRGDFARCFAPFFNFPICGLYTGGTLATRPAT
jgi:hypothetical protein